MKQSYCFLIFILSMQVGAQNFVDGYAGDDMSSQKFGGRITGMAWYGGCGLDDPKDVRIVEEEWMPINRQPLGIDDPAQVFGKGTSTPAAYRKNTTYGKVGGPMGVGKNVFFFLMSTNGNPPTDPGTPELCLLVPDGKSMNFEYCSFSNALGGATSSKTYCSIQKQKVPTFSPFAMPLFAPAPISILCAWYGATIKDFRYNATGLDEGLIGSSGSDVYLSIYEPNYSPNQTSRIDVVKQLQKHYADKGYLDIPADMLSFFGIQDPNPGDGKVLYILICYESKYFLITAGRNNKPFFFYPLPIDPKQRVLLPINVSATPASTPIQIPVPAAAPTAIQSPAPSPVDLSTSVPATSESTLMPTTKSTSTPDSGQTPVSVPTANSPLQMSAPVQVSEPVASTTLAIDPQLQKKITAISKRLGTVSKTVGQVGQLVSQKIADLNDRVKAVFASIAKSDESVLKTPIAVLEPPTQ